MRRFVVCLLAGAIGGAILATPSAAAPDGTRGAALMSAIVASNGTLVGGSGVQSVDAIPTGGYVVTFDRAINDCLHIAGPGLPAGSSQAVPFAFASTKQGPGSLPDDVVVEMRDVNGNFVTRAFHLFVFCAQ